jgi:succinyl-diaminopimelate desuccinylase
VRIPSVYRPEEQGGNENDVARFVADYLKNAGFRVRTEEVTPGRTNVWAV